jgi:hypothetical protein
MLNPISSATNVLPSSPALEIQPDQGKMLGFDFAAESAEQKKPMHAAEEI